MNERLKELRKKLALTQEDFAVRIGLSRNFITQVELGTKNPSERTISDICREFGVDETWLRTGTGDMFHARTRSQDLSAFFGDVLKAGDSDFRNQLAGVLAGLSVDEWRLLESMAKKLAEAEKED